MHRITISILFVLGFNKCQNANFKNISIHEKSFSFFFNESLIHNCESKEVCLFTFSRPECDWQCLRKLDLDDLNSICLYENESRPKMMALSIQNICKFLNKQNSSLSSFIPKEELISATNQRIKRQENEDGKDSEIFVSKDFLIQIAKYFQIKELLFVIDKTNITGK